MQTANRRCIDDAMPRDEHRRMLDAHEVIHRIRKWDLPSDSSALRGAMLMEHMESAELRQLVIAVATMLYRQSADGKEKLEHFFRAAGLGIKTPTLPGIAAVIDACQSMYEGGLLHTLAAGNDLAFEVRSDLQRILTDPSRTS